MQRQMLWWSPQSINQSINQSNNQIKSNAISSNEVGDVDIEDNDNGDEDIKDDGDGVRANEIWQQQLPKELVFFPKKVRFFLLSR